MEKLSSLTQFSTIFYVLKLIFLFVREHGIVTENADESLLVITKDGFPQRLIVVASPHLFIFWRYWGLSPEKRIEGKLHTTMDI